MQNEADLIPAALELLERRRCSGKVDLVEVANAVLSCGAESTDVANISAEKRRCMRCELIKSELSHRWEEAAAAAMSRSAVKDSLPDGDDRALDAKGRLLRRLDARPAISKDLRPPSLESFMAEWPGEFGDFTSVVDLSMHEFSVRKLVGDDPKIAEYEERFSSLANILRNRLADVEESLSVESSIRGLLRDTDPLLRFKESDAVGAASPGDSSEVKEADHSVTEQVSEQALLERVLRRVDFFRDLSSDLRLEVVKKLAIASFAAGDVLMHQGEPADGLLVLLEGTARVTVEEHGRIHDIARLVRRTVIGEMSLVTDTKRTASVVAETAGWVARLSNDDFKSLNARNPLLGVSLSALIANRLGGVEIDALYGKHIDRYEIRQRLGRGGMGIVYLAIDRDLAGPVALKMLPHDRAMDLLSSRRFRQEAQIVGRLTHPNVVRVLREFSAFGTTFIAMEWCDGPTLSDVIRRAGSLPPDVVRKLIGQIAAGLLYIHSAGIAHRDLKPSNILLTRQGNIKLADFGLARSVSMNDSELTGVGEMMGTPKYMAPEQIEGERGDPRSDLYSLGCIAYELWTGEPLFRATRWRELLQERAEWVLPLRDELVPAMDRPMYAILLGALREEPRDRDVDLAEIARSAAPINWAALPGVADLFKAARQG